MFIDDQPTFCVGAEAVGVRPIQITRDGVTGIPGVTSVNGVGWDFPVVSTLLDAKSLL